MEVEVPEGASADDALRVAVERWPALEAQASGVALAVNESYAGRDHRLASGDEVAIVPPVSGGSDDQVEIVRGPIDMGALVNAVVRPHCGAICTFGGTTRDHHDGRRVLRLEYDAYEPMARKELWSLVSAARAQWDLGAIVLVHRVGVVPVGEASVFIAVSSPHRAEAFAAGRFLIDRLKQVVPIWKREHYEDGSAWIEQCCVAGDGA